MVKPQRTSLIWMGSIATALGILVALQQVGFAMPWNSVTREEAASVYETKERADARYQMLLDINRKLDILIRRAR